MQRRKIVVVLVLLLLVAGMVWYNMRSRPSQEPPTPAPTVFIEPEPSTPTVTVEISTPVAIIEPVVKVSPSPIAKPSPVVSKPAPVVKKDPVSLAPPPTVIHKELIPKNIEIVRVYYQNDLMGPGAVTDFDINGTGFTKEFGQMIQVISGLSHVEVKNLRYVTLNQIRGTLVVSNESPTSVGHPQVLINGKAVFQAKEPYAVIRPGEVLNVVFTEMGESGRSGRFRIFTNLNEETFPSLSVIASTPAIQVVDLRPTLPFIVDATVQIGPALVGEYGMAIRLKENVLWERAGAIRIVQPDATEPGLAQRIRSDDGFYRPKDVIKFVVNGSGFQPRDTELLRLKISDWGLVSSSWTFVAPGRLDAVVKVPEKASIRSYDVEIMQGDKTLLSSPGVFSVVSGNWVRVIRLDPPLLPGKASALILEGRDFSKSFVEGLKATFDEEGLVVDSFNLMGTSKIVAEIQAKSTVAPGDYLMNLTSRGLVVNAHGGNVIRISD